MLAGDGSAYEREARLVRKDGGEIWAHITTSLVRGADGRPLHFLSVIHDISTQKRGERDLHESELRFRAMIEQSISGTCIIDSEGRFVYVNPRLAAILGHESADTITGRPVLEFVAPEDHAVVESNMRQRMKGEAQSARYNFQAIRKDGQRITMGAHGTLGLYGGKRVVIATVQDVTELRRAEEEIERTVAKLRHAVQSTIQVVSTIGELRDAYTHGHERRVGELATAIAAEMGLAADRIEGVRVAGYLHDVGKIAIPAEILSKPTRLTKNEFELVKQHAQQSYEILKGVDFPWPVAEAAWQHHERLDGSGYPRGLMDGAIILEARVLAVADTVEAMSSHRPYRPGLGIDKALAEIERGRGTLYDPAVADACLSLFRAKGYAIPS
jgi:PAS domain S-box-containing protein/putative nucleotidyltransferase with HDIG domain